MSKFSLILVSKEVDGKVDGYWIKDHIGNMESASVIANGVSDENRGIEVAIVDSVSTTTPGLSYFTGLTKLN
jgi:hypothetical protein